MDLNTLLSTLNRGTGTVAGSQTGLNVPARQRIELANPPAASGHADVYHSSGAPASASLLAQSGVNAYIQLLNALASAGLSEKSAGMLTNSLVAASATLKLAYHEAVSRLSAQLLTRDWRFSVSDGNLVFTAGSDELSAQDLADLQQAFAGANVESAASQVATAITSMELKRKSGADFGSLAWGRFAVDDDNFGDVVDLRAYLIATAPGGKYNPIPARLATADPTVTGPADHFQIPLTLGGMYLGDLITARPGFFQENVQATTAALPAVDAPCDTVGELLHGRCSCGEVRFTVQNDLDYAFYCHCSRCRLRTGSAFAAIAGVSMDKVQICAGGEHLLIEGECSDGYGARCSGCYVFLFAAVRDRQYVHVSLGVVVGTPSRVPDHHIYVGSKAPWYQITDALPQYDELP